MPAATLVSYDQVPYHSGPFRQTHPCHLAVLPILFGLSPPPLRGARVLELGCASGGNLIPTAQSLPENEFVGIDLSARQIADGRGVVAELGLPNVELRHASILDVDESFGYFEFIICHGVYSWVPRAVQDKILQIGAQNLAPDGVCYVSYNAYPGWHLRGVVRDMMRYHVAGFDDPQRQIDQARALLDFLNRSATPGGAAYRQLLADEAQLISRHSDSYLFHEHLEEINEPMYFHEFAERAAMAGLAYLGDTDFSTMLADNFDAETAAILREASLLRQEQYMDFLRNRMFRSSVLCHASARIDRNVPAARLAPCHVSLEAALPLPDSPARAGGAWEITVGSDKITVAQPITKAALAVLNERWPAGSPVAHLYELALAKLSGASPPPREASDEFGAQAQENVLLTDLMTLFTRGMLRVAYEPPPLATHAGARPRATPLARLQAQRGDLVTNQRHESVRLGDLPRALLSRLDGTRDRAALGDWLAGAIARGEFRVQRDEKPLAAVDGGTVAEILDGTLRALLQSALLVP